LIDATLILKVTLAPLLVLGATFAGNRWGHTVSGWIVGLPLTSAPVILLLALEQGNGFAAMSAGGTILGLGSLSTFSLVYSWLILRLRIGWVYSIVFGWSAFFLSSLLLEDISVSLIVSFTGVMIWLLLVTRLFPKSSYPSVQTGTGHSKIWDTLARMVAAVSLILVITAYAPSLGPRLSGLLTPFPVYTSVLALSIQREQGADSAVQFVRGATVSLFTPAVFFLIVGSLITSLGIILAYSIAIVVSLIVHLLLLRALIK
jgi:hypothetical protein